MRWLVIVALLARIAAAEPSEPELRKAVDDAFAANDDAKLQEAADRYMTQFAGGPYAVSVMWKLAKRAYDRKDFADAAKRLEIIVTKYPSDANAAAAGDLLLDSFVQLKQLDKVEATARMLEQQPAYKAPQQQERLDRVIEQAITVQADALVGEHADRKAAEMYQRAATEFPKSPRADELLFNAGSMYLRSNDPFRAAELLRKSAEVGHTGNLPLRAMFQAATLDQDWLPARAVDEYMRAAGMGCPPPQRGSNCGEVRDSLYNAGLLYFALGEHAKSATALGILVKADAANDEAPWLLGELAERAHDDARALAAFEAYAKRPGKRARDALLHAGRAALRLGKLERARTDLANALSLSQGFVQLAEVRFAQGETFEREAAGVALNVPPKQLRAALAKRTTLIAQTAAIYTDVVNAKDPKLAIAAIVRMGHLYADFDTALVGTPGPPGLTKEQLRLYREQLDQVSSGIKDKAIDAYKLALAKADAFAIVTDATIDAHAQLVRLAPAQFPPEREARAPLRDREYSPAIVFEAQPHR